LTPIPLYFSHIDGFMNKPPKSSLFNVLENPLSFPCNPFIDVYILGGVYLLHLAFAGRSPFNIWKNSI
jgi:hypothetical protein